MLFPEGVTNVSQMKVHDTARTELVDRPPVRIPAGVLIGAHLSIAGGTWRALERARHLGATAVQLFVKNNNRWKGKALGSDEGEKFRRARTEAGDPPAFAHSGYLINLASPDDALYQRSIDAMVDELERCAVLGLAGLVVHPGSPLDAGESFGLARIAAALDLVLDRDAVHPVHVVHTVHNRSQYSAGLPKIWLETTAGQGRSVGWRFEHLAAIMERVRTDRRERLGVCLDTCHVFAAGYDLRTPRAYDETLREFDRVIGLGRLRAIHVNDSKGDLGSRIDRHEHIGRGRLGRGAFRLVMRDDRLAATPKVLETPKGPHGEKDWDNLRALIRCAKKSSH